MTFTVTPKHLSILGVFIAMCVAGMTTGCGINGSSGQGIRTGHALAESGLGSAGFVTVPASRGHVYGFALQNLANSSKEPLIFESARVDHIPTGVRFVKMGLFSAEETNGTIMSGTDSAKDANGHTETDYSRFPNHYGQNIIIKPKADPIYYPVAFVRFDADHDVTVQDCTIFYEQGGKHYQQHEYCEFKLSTHYS